MTGSETIPTGSTPQAGGKREILTKVCCICKTDLPKTDFRFHPQTRDNRNSWCMRCESENSRWWHLAKKYNLSRERYTEILRQQGGLCPICGCNLGTVRVKRPCVDHCHKTQTVRGIICHNCNICIGMAKDNPERLRRAAEYVEAHNRVSNDIVPPAAESAAVSDPETLSE